MKIESTLVFEIIAGKSVPISLTKNKMDNEEEISQSILFLLEEDRKLI